MPSLALVRRWALLCRGAKQNFSCDQFARDFQAKLDDSKKPYTARILGFKRSVGNSYLKECELMSGRKRVGTQLLRGKEIPRYQDTTHVEPKIILREKNHPFDGFIVGNETHFWTEVSLDNGEIYCFDNHHPQGLPQAQFYQSFEFLLEKVLKDEIGAESQREIFLDEAHTYKRHDEILKDSHLVIKDVAAAQYIAPENNIYKWTTKPETKFTRASHHIFNHSFISDAQTKAKELSKVSLELATVGIFSDKTTQLTAGTHSAHQHTASR